MATPARANPDVTAWFSTYDNPQKQLMLAIRAFILEVDERLNECVKWKTPTFTYRGNIACFNPRAKRHVPLMFHPGATILGDHPRLIANGQTAAYMTFHDADDFATQRQDLAAA